MKGMSFQHGQYNKAPQQPTKVTTINEKMFIWNHLLSGLGNVMQNKKHCENRIDQYPWDQTII